MQVGEGHLGFYHPELGQVAGRVRVFGTEGGTEGVDGAQCRSCQLAFELTGYRQAGLLAEEVIVIDNRAILILLQVIEVLGGYLEHLSGAFTVGCRDDGGMEIVEALLMEEGVDGDGHVVTDAEDGSEGVGAGTQVGNLAQELHGVALLLQGIGVVTAAKHLDFACLNLGLLTGTYRFGQFTVHTEASAGGDFLEHSFVKVGQVNDNLHVVDG